MSREDCLVALCILSVTTLSTDELPSATKLISLEKIKLRCDSSEKVNQIKSMALLPKDCRM